MSDQDWAGAFCFFMFLGIFILAGLAIWKDSEW